MAIEMSRRFLVLGMMIKTMMVNKTSVRDDWGLFKDEWEIGWLTSALRKDTSFIRSWPNLTLAVGQAYSETYIQEWCRRLETTQQFINKFLVQSLVSHRMREYYKDKLNDWHAIRIVKTLFFSQSCSGISQEGLYEWRRCCQDSGEWWSCELVYWCRNKIFYGNRYFINL